MHRSRGLVALVAAGALSAGVLMGACDTGPGDSTGPGSDSDSVASTHVDATTEATDASGDASSGASSDAESDSESFLERCEPGPNPTLEIGGGLYSFEPWSTDKVEFVHGHQGGYHIDVSVLAARISPDDFADLVVRGFINGEQLALTELEVSLKCRLSGDGLEAAGYLLIWDAQPDELHGQLARIEASLTDAEGTKVEAAREIELVDPFHDA